MDSSCFTRFNDLPAELRLNIWRLAVETAIQDTIARLPRWFTPGVLEHRRQALVGAYPGQKRQSLVVYVQYDDQNNITRYTADEFEGFIHSFSLSASCQQARMHVAEACIGLATHVRFGYEQVNLEARLEGLDKHPGTILRDSRSYLRGAFGLPHFAPRPTTVTFTRRDFHTGDELVRSVTRFLGSNVERLIFDYPRAFRHTDTLFVDDEAVLAHQPTMIHYTASAERSYEQSQGSRTAHGTGLANDEFVTVSECVVTDDGAVYIPDTFYDHGDFTSIDYETYVCQMFDIFEAAKTNMPSLKHIDFSQMYSWETYDGPSFDCLVLRTT